MARKTNYISPKVLRHLVINGATIMDEGTHVSITWQWHVSSSSQVDSGFVCQNSFVRGNVKYIVWVSRRIGRVPDEEAQKQLVAEHYQYTLNPFGLVGNE